MASQLVPLCGGRPVRLTRRTVVLGRRPECDVPLNDGHVSGRHCKLTFEHDHWVVTDLDSKNGTYVNDKPAKHARLPPGAKLTVGRVVHFRIEYKPHEAAKELDASEVDHIFDFTGPDDPDAPATMIHPQGQKVHDIWLG